MFLSCRKGVAKVTEDTDRSFEGPEAVRPGPSKRLQFLS